MRLAVIGSKEFTDYARLKEILNSIDTVSEIISGAAPGTDRMAASYAKECHLKLVEFPPDFDRYGKEAKLVRNRQIVENCDYLIAFWDGVCQSTKYTIDYATASKIPVSIIEV
jgi:hypothetical protein